MGSGFMTRLLVGIFGLLLATTSLASFDSALKEYYSGNRNTAVRELRQLAIRGDANAQAFLGSMYASGEGVKQDFHSAIDWQTKAARQGHAQAQYNLAVMYSRGMGVRQNMETAVKWFQAAAEQGLPEARMHLGLFHEKGWVLRKCPYSASEQYYQAGQDYLQRGDIRGARNAALAIKKILPGYYLSSKLLTEISLYE